MSKLIERKEYYSLVLVSLQLAWYRLNEFLLPPLFMPVIPPQSLSIIQINWGASTYKINSCAVVCWIGRGIWCLETSLVYRQVSASLEQNPFCLVDKVEQSFYPLLQYLLGTTVLYIVMSDFKWTRTLSGQLQHLRIISLPWYEGARNSRVDKPSLERGIA